MLHIIVLVLLIGLCIFAIIYKPCVENFTPWPKKTIDDFLEFQRSTNENDYQYNLGVVQSQSSPAEVAELVKTGQWPWNDETKYKYMNAVNHSTIVRVNPLEAMGVARKKYNENAINDKLFWNTPEGNFILTGATVGDDAKTWVVQCGNDGVPIKTRVTGKSIPDAPQTLNVTELPYEVPGFKFLGPSCNPCKRLTDPNARCDFKVII